MTGGERLLAPGASTDVDIAFTPREARVYAETLQVSVIGLLTVRLRLQCEFARCAGQCAHPDPNSPAVSAGMLAPCCGKQSEPMSFE